MNKVLLYLLLSFLLPDVLGRELIVLHDSLEETELSGSYYELLKDSSGTLTIEQVTSAAFDSRFKVSKEEYNYVEDPEIIYWLRFRIRNISSEKKKWVLEYLSVHTQDMEFYTPQQDGSYQKKKIGQLFPFGIRDYRVSNFIFDLPEPVPDNKYFYVRINSRHPSGFEFKIRTQHYFTNYAVHEYYFLGIYYGILAIMAIYNFLLYFSSKEKVYLFYVMYVGSCMLHSFAEDGLGFQFIWSGFPQWNWNINHYLSSSLFLLSFILYSSSFLDLKKNAPEYLKYVYIFMSLYFGLFLIGFLLPWDVNFSFLYIFPFLIIYVAAVICYRKGYYPSRFFILGYSFVFISVIILQLRNFNLISHNLFTVYSFNFGIVLEVVVLSFALADRIRHMKMEKENAQRKLIAQLEENQQLQQKVNRELEQKVSERTRLLEEKSGQLEEANLKLQKMTEELNKFASKLDQDNWELNKKVIEEKKARMNSRELSFEEFCKIFPNDFTCLKYVEELKWGKGYLCKKCGHSRFATKPKLLARKCSRCNYIESVTSSTIFHAVKFPIQKAFFIAYITTVKQSLISVDKLSQILNLNRLTCYKFRKKVTERVKQKKDKIKNWETLIVDTESN